MPSPTLHVIASCTDRKTELPPQQLRLRSISKAPASERVALWRSALTEWGTEKLEAQRLYCGEHWSVAKLIVDAALERGFRPQLWIVSAGHGLVAANDFIAAYSATFSPGHPDSTCDSDSEGFDWWTHLTATSTRKGATRIADLASGNRDNLLVICSPQYIRNIEDDLVAAKSAARHRLVMVSSQHSGRIKQDHPLHDSMLIAEAKLRQRFGGSLTSLNARLALDLVSASSKGSLNVQHYRQRLKRLLQECPELPTFDRRRMADEIVANRISTALARKAIAHTRLLKIFRAKGWACEQSRFRRIYRNVKFGK